MQTLSDQQKKISRLYGEHFRGINRLQGLSDRIRAKEAAFVEAVTADQTITVRDLAEFIASQAFMNDFHRSISDHLPSD